MASTICPSLPPPLTDTHLDDLLELGSKHSAQRRLNAHLHRRRALAACVAGTLQKAEGEDGVDGVDGVGGEVAPWPCVSAQQECGTGTKERVPGCGTDAGMHGCRDVARMPGCGTDNGVWHG
eukprot:358836-Chlamydomonas_euryale.AAC.6